MPEALIVTADPAPDLAALGAEWQALEARATASVFQGWGWMGCLVEERFDRPLLLRATAGGRLVGLALFNRMGALHLHASGGGERDGPFVEHNGPLLARDAPTGTVEALLAAAWRAAGGAGLGLQGVAPDFARAAGGVAWRWQARPAPWIDLDAVRAAGGDWLAGASANARYQIRRSQRRLEADGPLACAAAQDPETAAAWLDELIALHDRRWAALGSSGAFHSPWQRRFHHALVARLLARDELDLLRITAGGALVGLVYNLRRGGHVCAYQSGWVEPAGDAHRKPGLTCQALAIERALARGDAAYDFLAGAQRYKQSLANATRELVWAELVPAWSWRAALARGKALARRVARRGP